MEKIQQGVVAGHLNEGLEQRGEEKPAHPAVQPVGDAAVVHFCELKSEAWFGHCKTEAGEGGAKNFHIILLDGGRSKLLGIDRQEMLRCLRCGACMNHCPVY